MPNIGLVRVGAIAAILTPVSFVLGAILLGASGGQDLIPVVDETGDWLVTASDNGPLFQAGGWFFVLAPLLSMAAGLAFFWVLHERAGDLLLLGLTAWVAGSILVTISHVVPLAMAFELSPAYLVADDGAKITLLALARTLAATSQIANIVGNALEGGIGAAGFALATLRGSLLPKWIGWVGIVTALFGWLGLLTTVSEVIADFSVIGILGFIVWMIAMGVAVLRLRAQPATSPLNTDRSQPASSG